MNMMKLLPLKYLLAAVGAVIAAMVLFTSVLVYNEAGFQTHIRTIFGEEKVVTEVGYATKWFGRATPWKQAQTVQFVTEPNQDNRGGDEFSSTVSGYKIVFLGNVDGDVEASTRFRLPTGDQFLKIAREYRTPDNFVQTALVPAIKETLQSTASLMSADDYFAGARSEFGSEFENQLSQGQYLTKRKEIERKNVRGRNQDAGAVSGTSLPGDVEEESKRSEFVTEKLLDSSGNPLRKQQQFVNMGVVVVEARITNIDPNPLYKQRMVKVQTALAELAVARQDRLKEEEQKLLVTARGEKEVEQKRQETLRDQIEQTTNAQTAKQLAIINAEREKESAEIAKLTSEELLQKAKIDAQATKTLADAEAYAKEAIITADGALDKKLAALVDINKVWADAASKAPVPSVMMGGGADGTSRQTEIGQLMQVMAVKAARDLSVDMSVKK
jgi:regulator of protease activity HflC (stomatin/prohibitin superfamily)